MFPVPPVKIKEERPDEAEIRELAAKMVEANKAKAAAAAAATTMSTGRPNMVQPGQAGIMSYLTRNNPSGINKLTIEKKSSATSGDKKPACDEESLMGRFGWVTLGKCHIPYIFRNGEKYCAVRMVENKLLNKYLSYLHSDIYSCTCVRSYYITEAEAKLLNEINLKHCEGCFGRETFTTKDLVVRLQDAGEFYNFLDVCYNKLLLSSSNPRDKCGFIRINGESVVPYTVREVQKFVPLFYFEGETDSLKLRAEKLEGWDLAYLKFCCKVQGIRNELFASETCSVISLNDIKSYFSPGTLFEDYWPSRVVDSQLLLPSSKTGTTMASGGMWTKQPPVSHSPVVSSAMTVTKLPTGVHQTRNTAAASMVPSANTMQQAVCNGWSGLVGGQATYQPIVSQPAGPMIRMTQAQTPIHNMAPTTTTRGGYNPVRPRATPQYYPTVSMPMTTQSSHLPSVAQPPPPLVRSGVAGASPMGYPTYGKDDWSACTYTSTAATTGLGIPGSSPSPLQHLIAASQHSPNSRSSSSHQMLPPAAPAYHYNTQQQRHTPPNNASAAAAAAAAASAKYPPPLIPVNGARYPTGTPGAYGSDVIDLSSPPQSPHRSNGGTTASNNNINDDVPGAKKLIQISETATSGSHIPYQVQKALVDNKMVPCINSKPFIYSELLMTLPDLVKDSIIESSKTSTLEYLSGFNGFEWPISSFHHCGWSQKKQQMQILQDAGKCKSTSDVLPLIQVRDVMQYMPQLKYMLGRVANNSSHDTSGTAKRQRTS
uniref:(California timema) hypothetical protein n=1 Tax=Timema californicum TaxID=61474 RepID=A0A7R9P2U7_TIMCA|nr:unnamed protein product [Timema californicum]